jgi:hypothetical protein
MERTTLIEGALSRFKSHITERALHLCVLPFKSTWIIRLDGISVQFIQKQRHQFIQKQTIFDSEELAVGWVSCNLSHGLSASHILVFLPRCEGVGPQFFIDVAVM